MWEIIKNGLRYNPSVGCKGAFNPRMFVRDRKAWNEYLRKMHDHGDQMFDDACPDADNGGHVNDIGMVEFIKRGGFVFAYIVDDYGDMCASCFTHEVISGELPKGPGYHLCEYE